MSGDTKPLSHMKKIPIFIIVFLAIFNSSCSKPEEVDIFGAWVISSSAKDVLANYRPDSMMTFYGNHTFAAKNLPHELLGDSLGNRPGAFSGDGTWELDQSSLWLGFQSIDKINVSIGTALQMRAWGAPTLFFYLGDPDEARIVEFHKAG